METIEQIISMQRGLQLHLTELSDTCFLKTDFQHQGEIQFEEAEVCYIHLIYTLLGIESHILCKKHWQHFVGCCFAAPEKL